MARAGDKRPAALRIGGWLPPTPERSAGDAAVTELIPVVTETTVGDPTGRSEQRSAPDAATSGDTTFADRRPQSGARHWRAAILVAVATAVAVAAATAVPVLLDVVSDRAGLDRQAQPPPAVTATDPIATDPAPGATALPEVARSIGGTPADSEPTRPASRPARPPTAADPTSGAPATSPETNAGRDSVNISIEAEGPSAVRGGRTSPRRVADASGGMVVGRIGNGSANLVQFIGVVVPAPGRYLVSFHYVSVETRSAAITVNGVPATHRFPASGPDRATVGTASIMLNLTSGENTITFSGGQARAPDLDRIVISGPPAR